jgi:hypothetical protein
LSSAKLGVSSWQFLGNVGILTKINKAESLPSNEEKGKEEERMATIK